MKTRANKNKVNTVTNSSIEVPNSALIASNQNLNQIGYGQANAILHSLGLLQPPKFSGNAKDFKLFQIKFRTHLIRCGLWDTLNSETPNPDLNQKLFMELTGAIENLNLESIAANCLDDGVKAYNQLCTKFLGDENTRELNAADELAVLNMANNEDLPHYISRCDILYNELSNHKMLNEKVFCSHVLRGLSNKYDSTRENINISDIARTYSNIKNKLLNFSLRQGETKRQKSESVMSVKQNPTTIVKPKVNNHYKKILNKERCEHCFSTYHKTHNCTSIRYCTTCKNKSHDTDYCRRILNSGAPRGAGGNHGPQRGSQNHGRFRGSRGASRGRGRGATPAFRGKNNRPQRQQESDTVEDQTSNRPVV